MLIEVSSHIIMSGVKRNIAAHRHDASLVRDYVADFLHNRSGVRVECRYVMPI